MEIKVKEVNENFRVGILCVNCEKWTTHKIPIVSAIKPILALAKRLGKLSEPESKEEGLLLYERISGSFICQNCQESEVEE